MCAICVLIKSFGHAWVWKCFYFLFLRMSICQSAHSCVYVYVFVFAFTLLLLTFFGCQFSPWVRTFILAHWLYCCSTYLPCLLLWLFAYFHWHSGAAGCQSCGRLLTTEVKTHRYFVDFAVVFGFFSNQCQF